MKNFLFILILTIFSCKHPPEKEATSFTYKNIVDETRSETTVPIKYAKGFSIHKKGSYSIVEVKTPWPNAKKTFTYLLVNKERMEALHRIDKKYDAIIVTPIKKIVATSTTHIPALEALGVEKSLVGFPGTDYVSSKSVRNRIDSGFVKDLGLNESINEEILIDLKPDLVMGFTIEGQNKTYSTIENTGIPVVYNGDWAEETPLGKAEWIKFVGALYEKEELANSIFNTVAATYNDAKKLASQAKNSPLVLSGSMFKDLWYAPAGESWVAHFLKDANSDYIWKDSYGSGSLSLSFETVLEKAQNADFWIGSGQYTSYKQLETSNLHYTQFDFFKKKKVYTYALSKGEKGGLLYYELAPNRPDIVLKDIIHILHPKILPDYQPVFFKQLKP